MDLHLLDWQFVGKFLEDRFALFHADLIRLSNELVLSIIYLSEVAFESVDQIVSNNLEFLVLVVTILILGQNNNFPA